MADDGIEAVLQVKTGHSLFPKDFIEKTLHGAPGGVHIVLKGKHPNGHTLYAIGYRYSKSKTLLFVMTSKAGSTTWGSKYENKFVDKYGNIGKLLFIHYPFTIYIILFHNAFFLFSQEIRHVERPEVISDFYRDSNSVDKHNHARQSSLALEKKWLTQNCFFQLLTTIIGITNRLLVPNASS